MQTSQQGLDLIKHFEGFRSKAYKCPAGKWTIGYGHTGNVEPGDIITEDEANILLAKDVRWAEQAIYDSGARLTQNQFDALVSFIYNVGAGNSRKSTLRRKAMQDATDPTIPGEFHRWNKAGGKVLAGLVARRNAEADLWAQG